MSCRGTGTIRSNCSDNSMREWFDRVLVGTVDGQPLPANPHGCWALSCCQAPVKRRKERLGEWNSRKTARAGGKRNTATLPEPAPVLALAADKEKASARLAFSNWWAPWESNPAPTDYAYSTTVFTAPFGFGVWTVSCLYDPPVQSLHLPQLRLLRSTYFMRLGSGLPRILQRLPRI